ncbi:DUF3299 domain-containing protein [Planctopirus hydrillae]|nr:DUF3299 domain-containing protein [Planctopirus hydrillae]
MNMSAVNSAVIDPGSDAVEVAGQISPSNALQEMGGPEEVNGTGETLPREDVVEKSVGTTRVSSLGLELPQGGYSEEEFSYRPVPVLVSISAGLVILGLSSFLTEWMLVLPLLGIFSALMALRKIRNSEGAYSGAGACKAMMVCASLIIAGAGSLHAMAYITEVPEGYQRVSFASDISAHGMKVVEGKVELPEAVQKLQNQPIFIKGYMYPSKQTAGITKFLLCKDSGDCCFGGAPKPTDMILISIPKEKAVDFSPGLKAVAGTFTLANGAEADGQSPVYQLNADQFYSPARTAY